MKRKDAAEPATDEDRTGHLLCAYSPTWLSGPTPGYRGLCPTWAADDARETGEHPAVPAS